MNRKKTAESSRPAGRAIAADSASQSGELSRLRRRMAIVAVLFVLSLAIAVYLGADWYVGLPNDAKAEFVGRQTCAQCHSTQHSAWTGSHHDLAMDLADDKTVLGDFNDAELTHH